jgi:hypothetical protein
MHSDISFSNPAATSSPTKSTQQQLQPQKRKDLPTHTSSISSCGETFSSSGSLLSYFFDISKKDPTAFAVSSA